jgi:hypothetical protein
VSGTTYSNDIYNPQPVLKIVPGQTQWGLLGTETEYIYGVETGEDLPRQTITSSAGVQQKKMNQSCMVITVPNSDLSSPS